MFKIRYEVATGRINLITNGQKEIPAEGCRYMTLKAYPRFNDQTEILYVRDGRIIAVNEMHAADARFYIKDGKVISVNKTHEPPQHRIISGVI